MIIGSTASQDMARRLYSITAVVIDDHAFFRQILNDTLVMLGVRRIILAADAQSGLQMIAEYRPDVVFVDLLMEGMNGIEVLKLVRNARDRSLKRTPVILVTASTKRSDLYAARSAGVDEIVAKPITATALEQRLRSVLLQRRAFVESDVYIGPCRRRRDDPFYDGPSRREDDGVGTDALRRAGDALRRYVSKPRALQPAGFAMLKKRAGDYVAAADTIRRSRAARRGGHSLLDYLDRVGQIGRVDREILATFGGGLAILADLDDSPQADEVADALDKLVGRRRAA